MIEQIGVVVASIFLVLAGIIIGMQFGDTRIAVKIRGWGNKNKKDGDNHGDGKDAGDGGEPASGGA